MVWTFEIIGILFAAVMIYFTRLEYKRARLSKPGYIFWNILWIGSIFLVFFHNYINGILPQLNIFRVLDLYMILAFMLLFSIVFHLFINVKNLEKRMEEVVRHVALKAIKSGS